MAASRMTHRADGNNSGDVWQGVAAEAFPPAPPNTDPPCSRPCGKPLTSRRPDIATASPCNRLLLDLAVEAALVVFVSDLVLILQQPVDGRLVVHGLVDRLGHGCTMNLEQSFVVEVVAGDDAGV